MNELNGKHAIVTGGGHGIGESIARALYKSGAKVTITGRNIEKLTATAHSMPGCNRYTLDISDEDAVANVFDILTKAHGPADILINNAGIAGSAPFIKIKTSEVRRLMEVNLIGTLTATQAVLPQMLENTWGRIINISSLAGIKGQAYLVPYSASKHAVIGLTRSLATELAQSPVTVNAICPGYVESNMLDQAIDAIMSSTGRSAREARLELEKINPQHRIIQPEEVAATVMWLCLPGSESVTGQSIALAGGEWM